MNGQLVCQDGPVFDKDQIVRLTEFGKFKRLATGEKVPAVGAPACWDKRRDTSMKVFLNGLSTGLILQLAIGPVFFYIVNLSLHKTIFDGLAAVLAVTIVDYLYITLAILGIGRLLQKKRIKKVFGIISSVILIVFGCITLQHIANQTISNTSLRYRLICSPVSAQLLFSLLPVR